MFRRLLPAFPVSPDGYCHLCHLKRFARKRTSQTSTNTAPVDAPTQAAPTHEQNDLALSVTGLRSGGMMAAPSTTSLDRIRAQVRAMQEEAQEKAEKAELSSRHEAESELERHRKITDSLKKSLFRRHKPNEACYSGKDAQERLVMRSEVVRRALLNEVDEVVRKSRNDDTLHYFKLAFPSSALDPDKVVSTAETLREECRAALVELKATMPTGAVSETDLRERSWLDVLEKKTAEELRFIWQSGLLDLADVERLLQGQTVSNAKMEQAGSSQTGTLGAEDEDDVLPLEMRVEQLHDIHYIQELANELRTNVLSGGGGTASGSIDLAPVLQKVHDKRYDDITDSDLKRLEQYEERPISLGETSTTAAQVVTESVVDRALSPSNRLLFCVAQKDEKVRHSLEVLERIKRQALFDPLFQEAVRAAHEMEETSVDGHVRGTPEEAVGGQSQAQRLRDVLGRNDDPADEENDDSLGGAQHKLSTSDVKKALSPRKQRTLRRRATALTRPHHAADVPYFFGDPRSIVPPRGNFNLPQPALSAQERAERRGHRRRTRGRTRFSK